MQGDISDNDFQHLLPNNIAVEKFEESFANHEDI